MEFKNKGEFGNGFLNWLQDTKGLKKRSAKDVISHIKRVSTYINLETGDSTDERDLIHLLNKNPEFDFLKPSVKSHLRRSIKLYMAFTREIRENSIRKLF